MLTAEIVGEFPGLPLSRFWRKLRGLTGCVVLCQREGLSPLRFSELFVR